jgi:hypothetical protein
MADIDFTATWNGYGAPRSYSFQGAKRRANTLGY